jgi:REP element-mobilizing transposase RayT
VHILARLHASVPVARLAGVMKGTSSGAVRRGLAPAADFGWQSGYGAFSVGPREVPTIERYIASQKEHHASARVVREWEPPSDEEVLLRPAEATV